MEAEEAVSNPADLLAGKWVRLAISSAGKTVEDD